jgi:hypothetical protein
MNQLDKSFQSPQRPATVKELRLTGYNKNYSLSPERTLYCRKDNSHLDYDTAAITLVDHVVYDNFDSQGLLLFFETSAGEKGVINLPSAPRKRKSTLKPKVDPIEAFWLAL